jgi:hypothetical protein
MMPRILAFAGSTRSESSNKKLVSIAAKGARDADPEGAAAKVKAEGLRRAIKQLGPTV